MLTVLAKYFFSFFLLLGAYSICFSQGIVDAVLSKNVVKVQSYLAADCSLAETNPDIALSQKWGRNTSFRHLINLAVFVHDISIVKLLLDCGADIDSRGAGNGTPLSWAATFGDNSMVKFLLEKGANPRTRDNDGLTPLHAAAAGGFLEVTKLLLKYGANKYSRD